MCLWSLGWQIQIMPGFLCRGKTDHIGVTLFSGWGSPNHCPLYRALKQCNPFGLALPLHKIFNCDKTLLNQPVLVSYWEAYGWYQHWYQGPYWACMTWANTSLVAVVASWELEVMPGIYLPCTSFNIIYIYLPYTSKYQSVLDPIPGMKIWKHEAADDLFIHTIYGKS